MHITAALFNQTEEQRKSFNGIGVRTTGWTGPHKGWKGHPKLRYYPYEPPVHCMFSIHLLDRCCCQWHYCIELHSRVPARTLCLIFSCSRRRNTKLENDHNFLSIPPEFDSTYFQVTNGNSSCNFKMTRVKYGKISVPNFRYSRFRTNVMLKII